MSPLINLALFFSCLTGIERLPIKEDRVDYIEINHVYDEKGLHTTDQLIFWDISQREDYRYKCLVDWRVVRGDREKVSKEENKRLRNIFEKAGVEVDAGYVFTKFLGLNIQKNPIGQYYFVFWDGDVIRKVYANSIIETWTQQDNEVEQGRFQTREDRPGLTK